MQPHVKPEDSSEHKESPVQATVLAREGQDDRPIGSGVLVAPLVVLADETLSRLLYDRQDLFPGEQDDLAVLFPRPGADDVDPGQAPPADATTPTDAATPTDPASPAPPAPGDAAVPAFVVELVEGERTERIEVCELYRSLDRPRRWVGLGLAQASTLPLSDLPPEAMDGLFDPLERSNWVCVLIPKACR